MREHLWEGKSGLIHSCKESDSVGHPNLVWTNCGIDVPAGKSFRSFHETATCKKCKEQPQ